MRCATSTSDGINDKCWPWFKVAKRNSNSNNNKQQFIQKTICDDIFPFVTGQNVLSRCIVACYTFLTKTSNCSTGYCCGLWFVVVHGSCTVLYLNLEYFMAKCTELKTLKQWQCRTTGGTSKKNCTQQNHWKQGKEMKRWKPKMEKKMK